ncbi:MAG: lipopolysaccharide biosynthesis protein [Zymomonas mobilis]|uniref:lipopolysaccharide biosynthesis protein n=1 Tax=Zymomonas mobilis TaxID=542 RepID=UPI0039EAC3EA
MTTLNKEEAEAKDIAILAKGGRTNVFGFLLRLAARIPFLFIAGRIYGADALGRFAYAILVTEFTAQLATLGLTRGLAEKLARTKKDENHVVGDALLLSLITASIGAVILSFLPILMFRGAPVSFADHWLFPWVVVPLVWADIALAALAFYGDIAASVKAQAIIEPWVLSISSVIFIWIAPHEGLLLSYVASAVAALAASLYPLLKRFGWPHGWRPHIPTLFSLARRNIPLAAADAIEWSSRRLDIVLLGLFFSSSVVGVYYVAQQVASLVQKLKTSFDPILGPVITRSLEAGDKAAVANQVRQVGFWIIAAQTGVTLALGLTSHGVMGLVGPRFAGGDGALCFLLVAEVVAATAVISEAALIYIAPKTNMAISIAMLSLQAALSIPLISVLHKHLGHNPLPSDLAAAAGPALALAISLGTGSILKSCLLRRLLKAPVSPWKWALLPAVIGAGAVGMVARQFPEWLELSLGVIMILVSYSSIIWYLGFSAEDRMLFKRQKIPDLAEPVMKADEEEA